jgi:hypothetical protein
MNENTPLGRLRHRLREQRHWAVGILFGGLLLGVLASVLYSSNAQSAEHALQTDPSTIYRGDFRLYTADGFTNFVVDNEPILRDLFASLVNGTRIARVAPGNFDLLLYASLYSRDGPVIEFVCVSNDEAGPWFALVNDVYPLRLEDYRAVQRVLANAEGTGVRSSVPDRAASSKAPLLLDERRSR